MRKKSDSGISRRKFLGQMSCAAVGSTAFYSTLINLLATNQVSAQSLIPGSGHKALVCLFMSGGNDSYNMLAPLEAEEYSRYASMRTGLKIAQEDLLPITDSVSGKAYGLHPTMSGIQSLYDSGDLSFVCNVGTLIEPTTLQAYQNRSARLPLGLYSHADQIMHWQTATPDKRDAKGWFGRMADVLNTANENPEISMNISLRGSNILQSGDSVIPYAVTRNGAIDLQFYGEENHEYFKGTVDSLLEQEYQNLLQSTYARLNRESIELGVQFNAAIDLGTPFSTEFPNTDPNIVPDYDINPYSQQLQMIARSIAANQPLGHVRQTFLANYHGWDTHDNHMYDHGRQTAWVSEAVTAFWAAITELGMQDQVVLFTASDFGRTLTINNDGSDHGWGGHHFVLGGGVNGGRLFGEYPENLGKDGDLNTGRGRFIPTLSVDQYFAELALWMGTDPSNLPHMLPNVDRFYDINSGTTPIGLWG